MTQPPPAAAAERSLVLPDGRRLGYADHGAPGGQPVLFFHGSPGSRYELDAEMLAMAGKRGLRLIAPERPGYGLSDPQPGRSLQDWATDVAALADALGIEACSIIGFSMGSIYALACAKNMPKRVDRLALVGGFAPLDAPGVTQGMAPEVSGLLTLAQTDPDGLRNALLPLAQSPAALLTAMAEFMAACDKRILHQHALAYTADLSEALRQGVDGIGTDFVLAAHPWGFSLADIKAQVHLWHGDQDCNAPPAMATYLASALPNRSLFMLPGEGHMALFTHWDDILGQLLGS